MGSRRRKACLARMRAKGPLGAAGLWPGASLEWRLWALHPRLAACAGSLGWAPLGWVTAGSSRTPWWVLPGPPAQPGPASPVGLARAALLQSSRPSGLIRPEHQTQTSPAFLEPPGRSQYRASWWMPERGRTCHGHRGHAGG